MVHHTSPLCQPTRTHVHLQHRRRRGHLLPERSLQSRVAVRDLLGHGRGGRGGLRLCSRLHDVPAPPVLRQLRVDGRAHPRLPRSRRVLARAQPRAGSGSSDAPSSAGCVRKWRAGLVAHSHLPGPRVAVLHRRHCPPFVRGSRSARMLFFYESPRFLVSQKKFAQAREVLVAMARMNGKRMSDLLPESVPLQDMIIPDSDVNNRGSSLPKLLTIFSRAYIRRTLCLSVAYVCLTTGYYSTTVFLPALLAQLNLNPYFISFVSILGQIPGIFLISILTELPCVGRLHTLRLMTLFTVAFFLLFAFVRNDISIPVSGRDHDILLHGPHVAPDVHNPLRVLSNRDKGTGIQFLQHSLRQFWSWASIPWWVSSGAGHPLAIPFHGSCSLCYSTCGSCLSEP